MKGGLRGNKHHSKEVRERTENQRGEGGGEGSKGGERSTNLANVSAAFGDPVLPGRAASAWTVSTAASAWTVSTAVSSAWTVSTAVSSAHRSSKNSVGESVWEHCPTSVGEDGAGASVLVGEDSAGSAFK